MSNVDQILYDKVLVYANGKLLAEEAQATFSRQTNASNVVTTAKGFAGQTPGGAMCSVNVTNAVPVSGFELDVGQYMNELKQLELVIFTAGKSCNVKVFVTDDNLSHAMNSNANLAFTGIGPLPLWS